ncbi:hypothetical protein EIP86_008424 [Pleurotus ostreatoroseus]|nr:hypothetical protein EIP86_008424 [Pleurotus ostreatoroseus]
MSEETIGAQGKWVFLKSSYKDDTVSTSIWHSTQPLTRLRNAKTCQILDMMQNELYKWLDPYSMTPLAIPKLYQLPKDHILICGQGYSVVATEVEAFKLVLDYAKLVGEVQAAVSGEEPPCQLSWQVDNSASKYPQPSFSTLLSVYSCPRILVQAILSLMRYSSCYDGTPDLIFERKIATTVKSMFRPWCSAYSPSVNDGYSIEGMSGPLITVIQSEVLTLEIRKEMATRAYPALLKLLHISPKNEAFPEQYFVYGLHISPTHTSILAHFPVMVDDCGGWRFGQVVLAKITSAYDCTHGNEDEDDVFLYRWRLCIALLTIVQHILELEKILGASPGSTITALTPENDYIRPRPCCQYRRSNSLQQSSSAEHQTLRAIWRRKKLELPSSWVTPQVISLDTRTISGFGRARCVHYTRQRADLVFHHLRSHIIPLSDAILDRIHTSSSSFDVDFLHSTHMPRSRAVRSRATGDSRGKLNIFAYYIRAYDFLTMVADEWADVNLFVANVLTGFSTYSVQWRPVIRYPTTEIHFKTGFCVVDFALAARPVPATMRTTLERSHLLPLTITSPAVLLGVRATHFHDDGKNVSQDEMNALTEIMRPHLNLFPLLQRYNVIIPPYAPSINTSPTLYCTYLKKGFLHILAFARSDHDDSRISGYLIDSLPLSLSYNTQEDFIERMRVVLALFALQRQAVWICEGWNSICWPNKVLIEEHEIIVEVTGVATPSPSADLPPPDPKTDLEFDFGVEDNPSYMKGEIAKSKKYVSEWLSKLDKPQDDVRGSFMSL